MRESIYSNFQRFCISGLLTTSDKSTHCRNRLPKSPSIGYVLPHTELTGFGALLAAHPTQTILSANVAVHPKTLVVIATYNEIENLPTLVDQVQSHLPEADLLVIDDNSPDGTGRWCDARAQSDDRFHVIHRSGKLGLGSATICGFQYGLQNSYELIATMDADFSHAPASLAEMMRTIQLSENSDCGLIIGSRYVRGGGIVGWPLFRHLSSRAVNLAARFLLQVPTRDNSGAFRIYRSSALEAVDVDQIQADGYAYLEELIWRIHRADIPMVEVPITFIDREKGASKTSLLIGFKVFWHLLKIGLGRVK